MTDQLSHDAIMQFMDDMCAPWINQLDLNLVSVGDKTATFTWHAGLDLCREVVGAPPIVSGQATMAVADTASFLTICALNNALMNCTTVDMGTNFMRPLMSGDVTVVMTALTLGRKLVTMRAEFMQNGKMAATSTGVFAYL